MPVHTGGRVAAFEVLVNMPAVAHHIREAKIALLESVIQTNAAYGMPTMSASIDGLVAQGTDLADALEG